MKYLPVFWKCGGGELPYKYGFGYWVEGEDLLCINRKPKDPETELSPICNTKIKAIIAFLKNKINLKVR